LKNIFEVPPAEGLCLDTKKQGSMLQFFFICGKNLKNIFAALNIFGTKNIGR
jgi:hypothetical protein